MKNFLISFAALVLAQGLKVEEALNKDPFEKDVEELLVPLLKEYTELNKLIEEMKQYQETQKISSLAFAESVANLPPHCLPADIPFIEGWDEDACQKLEATLNKALVLGKNISDWALKAGLTILKEIYHLIHCGNVNPVTAIKCVVNTIDDIKDTIYAYKPFVLKFKNEIVALVKELKVEFKQCLGLQKNAQAIAEQLLVHVQLCDKMKPLEPPNE